ncbi:TIGR02234 family membrane protein [Streptomyces sp. NBC_01537]
MTQPRTDEAPVPPAARGGGGGGGARRSVTAALLLGAAGATIVLLAKGRIWMNGTVDIGAGGIRSVSATGQQVGGLPGSLALVAMAAFVAVFAVRGAGRVALAGLLALCGAGTVAAALSSLDDPSAMNAAAATATALVHATVSEHTTTAWPLLSAAGGALLLAAGIIALVRGRAWPAMSSRYDREGAEPGMRRQRKPVVDPDRPEDLWKALDRGEDPTEAG